MINYGLGDLKELFFGLNEVTNLNSSWEFNLLGNAELHLAGHSLLGFFLEEVIGMLWMSTQMFQIVPRVCRQNIFARFPQVCSESLFLNKIRWVITPSPRKQYNYFIDQARGCKGHHINIIATFGEKISNSLANTNEGTPKKIFFFEREFVGPHYTTAGIIAQLRFRVIERFFTHLCNSWQKKSVFHSTFDDFWRFWIGFCWWNTTSKLVVIVNWCCSKDCQYSVALRLCDNWKEQQTRTIFSGAGLSWWLTDKGCQWDLDNVSKRNQKGHLGQWNSFAY